MLRREINELLTADRAGHARWASCSGSTGCPPARGGTARRTTAPPVRVKMLSERLVAFRDSYGRYGLIDEFCAHRGASLWFGRNEEGGLRCPYHGWKYDTTGQCIEVPSEPDNCSFAENVKLTAYPLVKIGDVLWTYMGDPAKQPPLPEYEFALVPAGADLHAPSAGSSATGCRPSRAASTPATSRSCTRAASRATRCSRAPRATSTTSTTPSRSSRSPTARAACSSVPAATPRRASTTGGSRPG